ncbi:2'-5' RNA ligase family protein [Aeromicrobium sp. CF4.19]|uniref:2'-5' RNA ligase family protein n=1 Tax=Aeromicrobium sp. CF4.19 TaxID=3373082 RepID=UPI003EE7657A
MPDDLRYGVAIAIPEPHGSSLRARRASFGDPLAVEVPTHVTIVPPTDVAPDGLALVTERVAEVASGMDPFTMTLLGTGTFRPVSPVVFVAVSRGIAESEILADRVRTALDAQPTQFPYHPHVTVAQHLDDEALDRAHGELAGFTCTFEVAEVALYLHDATTGWAPHVALPFAGG